MVLGLRDLRVHSGHPRPFSASQPEGGEHQGQDGLRDHHHGNSFLHLVYVEFYQGDSPSAAHCTLHTAHCTLHTAHHRQWPGHGLQRQAVPCRGGGCSRRPQDLQTVLQRGHTSHILTGLNILFPGLYPRKFLGFGKEDMWVYTLPWNYPTVLNPDLQFVTYLETTASPRP